MLFGAAHSVLASASLSSRSSPCCPACSPCLLSCATHFDCHPTPHRPGNRSAHSRAIHPGGLPHRPARCAALRCAVLCFAVLCCAVQLWMCSKTGFARLLATSMASMMA